MKIPKYVLELVIKRKRYAERAMNAAVDLQTWLDNNDISIEEYDAVGGSETLANPYQSACRVINAILEKE